MTGRFLPLLLSAPAFPLSQEARAAPQPRMINLRCGTLIDGKSDAVRRDAVVAVEGDRIKEVRGAGAIDAGSGIDLSRETGFIDAHTHVLLQGDVSAV